MNRRAAYGVASMWGSYNNGSDPGRCFYSFYSDDARPMSEEHRTECVEYAKECYSRLETGHAMTSMEGVQTDEEVARDLADLTDLIAFFETTELHPTAGKVAA